MPPALASGPACQREGLAARPVWLAAGATGAEVQIALTGHAFKKMLSYGLHVEVMFPFAHNAETDLKGAELINTEIKALLADMRAAMDAS